jgi:glucose/arabinose dehydrogenase
MVWIRELALATAFIGVAMGLAIAAEVVGHSIRPARHDATEERIRQLKTPAGFTVSVLARDLGNPRMMVVTDDGTVYVSRPDTDDVIALPWREGRMDGPPRTILSGLERAHGLALAADRLYVAGVKKIVSAQLGRGALQWQTIVDTLPDGGQHGRRTIGIRPDGQLLVSIGSSCNSCDETNPEHATLLAIPPAGGSRGIFARGLRNTIGFAWHPDTKDLWGMDHGSDWRGDDQPPEELNKLEEGGDYGWPVCFGDRRPDPLFESQTVKDKAAHCQRTHSPALQYQAHSAPIAMIFYTGTQFPTEYRNDAFVAMRGSWNRKPPTGYKVVRIRFKNGQPVGFEDFLHSFLIEGGAAHFGRVAGLAVAKDGARCSSRTTRME